MKPEYLIVAIATLVYLIVDIYPSIKSFSAFVRTPSFWLLWAIFSIINVIAWAALKIAAGNKLLTHLNNDPTLADLTVVILSTLSTLTILQSFTVKIADYKFVDLGALLESFRNRVLSDMGDAVAKLTRLAENKLADRMFGQFQNDLQRLRDEYAQVTSFGTRTLPEIGKELTDLQNDCATNNLSFGRQLSLRVVKADFVRAKQIVT